MKSKLFNNVRLSGLLYDHNLTSKVSGPNSKTPGTEFITGTISVATDDALLNVVDVHFTYVTPTTSKGENAVFKVLKGIIDGTNKTVMRDGAEDATKVRVDSAIGLNDFYTEKDGEETLVSAKRNEGGFVRIVNALSDSIDDRNLFDVDMVITGVKRLDGDPDRGTNDKVIVKGAVFDFRKSLLPVELSVTNPKAMDYFEGLEATSKNPVFTHLKGREVNETITKVITEESAFGEDSVREIKNTKRDFVVHWAAKEPYAFDDPDFLTSDELKQAMADRTTYLADVKARNDAYKANKGNAIASAPAAKAAPKAAASDEAFDF